MGPCAAPRAGNESGSEMLCCLLAGGERCRRAELLLSVLKQGRHGLLGL